MKFTTEELLLGLQIRDLAFLFNKADTPAGLPEEAAKKWRQEHLIDSFKAAANEAIGGATFMRRYLELKQSEDQPNSEPPSAP